FGPDTLRIRCGGPIAVRCDHQLSFRVYKNTLAKNALCGETSVVIGPPLIAVSAARHVDVCLLSRCRSEPVIRQHFLAVRHAASEDELSETRIVPQAGRQAAAADLMASRPEHPYRVLLHPEGFPDLLREIIGQGFAR